MKKRRVGIRSFAPLAAVALVLAGCASSDNSSTPTNAGEGAESTELQTVKVGLSSFQDVCSIYVGIEKGFYAEAGVELDVVRTDWPGANELGIGGQVDMWTTSEADVIQQNDSGADTSLAFPLFYFGGGGLMYDPTKHTWETYDDVIQEEGDVQSAISRVLGQAKGFTVGVSSGGGEYATFVELVSQGGLQISDFNIVDLAQEELPPALISGSVDIMIAGIPQRLAVGALGYETLMDQRALPSTIIHAGFGAKRSWVDENLELAQAIQSTIFRTLAYVEDNPDESFQIIADCMAVGGTEIDVNELGGIWNVMEFFPDSVEWYEANVLAADGTFYWRDRFETVVENLKSEGRISDGFSVPLEDLNYGLKTVG